MTAYGAVISLENTINHILHSYRLRLGGPSRKIIDRVYRELPPLRNILKRLDSTRKSRSRKKVNALDARIKQTIWKSQDLLESLLSDQIISQLQIPLELRKILHQESESSRRRRSYCERDALLLFISVQQLQDAVNSFIHTLKDMKKEYIYELENMAEDDDDESSSSTTGSGFGFGFGGIMKPKMIRLSDQVEEAKHELIMCIPYDGKKMFALTLVGMAGIGKTSLAKEIYQDPQVLSHFECRAWVTVGRLYQPDRVVRDILAQLDPNMNIEYGITESDQHISSECLRERLDGKKCLIVLDDVWEEEVAVSLMRSPFFKQDAKVINGTIIRILCTARDRGLSDGFNSYGPSRCIVVRFLKDKESKDLLCHRVFGEEGIICPPQLDEAATKIAHKCEGLPLLILAVADILSKDHNRDPEYWEEVAQERNSVFTDALDQISKVLFPSYDYLSQDFKMLFLYMGVFPPDYHIPLSKLINTLTGEGWFIKNFFFSGYSVLKSLEKLCLYSTLVLFKEKSRRGFMDIEFDTGRPITFRLHPSWHHLCKREASTNKFFRVLNRLVDAPEEAIKGQRCLSLQNNILFAIKEFRDTVGCNCASSTRSLLFFGPYHRYPIPIGVDFKLLGELDALQLRFYSFPTEILSLVLLKYLALTCNGDLPPTISNLFNLRVLIIHPHIAVTSCDGVPSFVPVEIWNMAELEHIEIMGRNLLAPNHIVSLEKMSRLVRVNTSIGTISKLSKRIPRVRKLGVQIELKPSDDLGHIFSCVAPILSLKSLFKLKCRVVNPVFSPGYVFSVTPTSLVLPSVLQTLHLSGMGLPWEYMDAVGSVPYLEVVKLKSYAFRGPNWETKESSFPNLEFLIIEDTDLVQWKRCSGSLRRLRFLSLKHCYKLREIQWQLQAGSFKGKIELVDCNPLAVACARGIAFKNVTAYSSF